MKKAEQIEILARGVMVSRGQLLVCRNKKAGILYLPGGHVEIGEGAEKAVCREIMEEMGKKSRVKRFLGCAEHAFMQRGKPHEEINLVFEVAIEGVKVTQNPGSREDYIEFQWVPLNGLARLPFEPVALGRLLPRWMKAGNKGNWQSNMKSGR
jgi:8-oxo-dGTP diphosphatase